MNDINKLDIDVQKIIGNITAGDGAGSAPDPDCPACRDSGFQDRVRDGKRVMVECACRREKMIKAVVGEHFYEKAKTFDSYHPINRGQAEALRRIKENPDGSYFLHGDHGVGKTHLLACQYSWMVRNRPGRHLVFVSDSDLSSSFLASLKDEAKEPVITPERIKKADGGFHLFIKEFGKTIWRPIIQEHLFAIVDAIYCRREGDKSGFGISIASNLSIEDTVKGFEELEKFHGFGGGIARRVEEMAGSMLEIRKRKEDGK